MHSIIRMSEATALGLHAMAIISEHFSLDAESMVSVQAIATELNASTNHLSKVLQRLSHGGLVRSVRGPGGGFALAKSPSEISLLSIYELLEGPLTLSGCLFSDSICERSHCIMGGLIDRINTEVLDYLTHTTLDTLTEKGCITNLNETPETAS